MTDERALSQLFHAALDREDVAGPYQRLRLEIEKPGAARRRGRRTIFMTRNRLVLLAAALVLVIGISVVIGTRVFTANRVGETINAGPDQKTVAQLLARPLQIKTIAQAQPCPNGPEDKANVVYGAGPIYLLPGPPMNGTSDDYSYIGILTPLGMNGPVIVRGMDMRTGQPMVFISKYAVGPVFGTDTVADGAAKQTQYTAVAIDPSHPPAERYTYKGVTYAEWHLYNGLPKDSTQCVGGEFDGTDFSEVVYTAPGNY